MNSPVPSDEDLDTAEIRERRRQIVLDLIRTRFGTRAKFADFVGLQRPYVSRMLKPPGGQDSNSRNIGQEVALAIEQACELPRGTLLYPKATVAPEGVIGASLDRPVTAHRSRVAPGGAARRRDLLGVPGGAQRPDRSRQALKRFRSWGYPAVQKCAQMLLKGIAHRWTTWYIPACRCCDPARQH